MSDLLQRCISAGLQVDIGERPNGNVDASITSAGAETTGRGTGPDIDSAIRKAADGFHYQATVMASYHQGMMHLNNQWAEMAKEMVEE